MAFAVLYVRDEDTSFVKEVLDEHYIDYDWDSGDRLLIKSEMTDDVIEVIGLLEDKGVSFDIIQ